MLDAMVKLAKIFCYGSIGIGAVYTTKMSDDYLRWSLNIHEEKENEENEDSEK